MTPGGGDGAYAPTRATSEPTCCGLEGARSGSSRLDRPGGRCRACLVRSVRHAGADNDDDRQRGVGRPVVAWVHVDTSTWSGPSVTCKAQSPRSRGTKWAAAVEGAVDRVLDGCVGLDPLDVTVSAHRSDGRSVWVSRSPPATPQSRSSPGSSLLSWALDPATDEPAPSLTVAGEGLNVLQADVAAAVAGHERLVVVVGQREWGRRPCWPSRRRPLPRRAGGVRLPDGKRSAVRAIPWSSSSSGRGRVTAPGLVYQFVTTRRSLLLRTQR